MADLYLVRHGQASFGAANYDKLSALGEDQASRLGAWIKSCGVTPDAVASGPPSRQLRTAELAMAATGGPSLDAVLMLDGLGEYDHDEVLYRLRPEYEDRAVLNADLAKQDNPKRAFQRIYEQAVARWVAGEHDADYGQTWTAFRSCAVEALRMLTNRPERSIWAFTSGGPIAAIVQHLLAIPDSHAFEINWALVNTGVTRLRFSAGSRPDGRFAPDGRAVSLSYINAFPHLEQAGDPALITYR
jgi:broad specificity phosphatase PhoE